MYEKLPSERAEGDRASGVDQRHAGQQGRAKSRLNLCRYASPLVVILGAIDSAHAAGDRDLGQHLSSECVTCHNPSGKNAAGVPQIIGWPDDQFVAVMNSYKEKQRDNPVMQTIAGRLKTEDIEALAAYFGELKAPKEQAPAKRTKGRER